MFLLMIVRENGKTGRQLTEGTRRNGNHTHSLLFVPAPAIVAVIAIARAMVKAPSRFHRQISVEFSGRRALELGHFSDVGGMVQKKGPRKKPTTTAQLLLTSMLTVY